MRNNEHERLVRRVNRSYKAKVAAIKAKKALAFVLAGAGVSTVFCAIGLTFLGIAGTAALTVGCILTLAGCIVGVRAESEEGRG